MKQLASVALAWCALHSGTALAAHCSNQTLHGTLVGALSRSGPTPSATMFMESWDGAGHINYFESDSNGTQTFNYNGTAVFSISADCIATVYYDGATTTPWLYYVNPDGKGYAFVNNRNTGVVAAGRTELMSSALLVNPAATSPGPCSLASLKGVMGWAAESSRQGVPHASDGTETYDGAGHMVYRETETNGYINYSYSGTGTYTITDRCVASVYYDGSPTPFVYLVAPDGSAYWWVNNQNAGTVAAGKVVRISGDD
jgi:hypothetical protein